MDNRFDTDNSMGARVGDRLYDGLFYSCTAGHCHYRCADQSHSGAKTCIDDFLITCTGVNFINVAIYNREKKNEKSYFIDSTDGFCIRLVFGLRRWASNMAG